MLRLSPAEVCLCTVLLAAAVAPLPLHGQLDAEGNQRWGQDPENGTGDLEGSKSGGDFFGATVEAGDFDNDGFDDLAVGVTGEDNNGGSVNIIRGSANRLTADGNQRWQQGDENGLPGDQDQNDSFGAALAIGDFNGDGFDDLAVGAPGEDSAKGRLTIIFGSTGSLTADGSDQIDEDSPGVIDLDDGYSFAAALAAGDFNNDGFDDLAIGVPGEDDSRGAVQTVLGSDDGLDLDTIRLWQQEHSDLGGERDDGDGFGAALETGDFNNDGFDDLAIGAPGNEDGEGAVHILLGSSQGPTGANRVWAQGLKDIVGNPEGGDRFGAALAAGDFDGDGFMDLAVGVPGEDGGGVHVIHGAAGGLTAMGNQFWQQGQGGIDGDAEGGDNAGSSLAAGDFSGDGYDDLAFGVPGEDGGEGEAIVLYGTAEGLTSAGYQVWSQDYSEDFSGGREDGDLFAFALAAGDFDGDRIADLAAGVPGEDGGAGVVNVIYGTLAPPVASAVVGAGLSVPLVNRISSNGIVSVFGERFVAPGAQSIATGQGGRLPDELGGVCVEIDGTRAPLFFVSPLQINAQTPPIPESGQVDVTVVRDCGREREIRSEPFRVNARRTSPEFFFFVFNEGGVNPIAAVNESVPRRGRLVGDRSLRNVLNANFEPARPGDAVTVFMTGLGPTNPSVAPGRLASSGTLAETEDPVSVRIGGESVQVLFAGLTPGFAGLYQVSFFIPDNAAEGDLPVQVEVGGAPTPPGGFLTVER